LTKQYIKMHVGKAKVYCKFNRNPKQKPTRYYFKQMYISYRCVCLGGNRITKYIKSMCINTTTYKFISRKCPSDVPIGYLLSEFVSRCNLCFQNKHFVSEGEPFSFIQEKTILDYILFEKNILLNVWQVTEFSKKGLFPIHPIIYQLRGNLCHSTSQQSDARAFWHNLILFVTQNLIGSFDFSEIFYIVNNNLPWRHNAVAFLASTILVRTIQNPLFLSTDS
jgi:hypothetical protein